MIYRTGQVAGMLGISGPKVRQLINDGELPCVRMPMSGIARVNSDDLTAFCSKHGLNPGRMMREGTYTVSKVAEIADVSVPTVRKWIDSGALPSFGKGIGYCKVFPSELEKFLKKSLTRRARR